MMAEGKWSKMAKECPWRRGWYNSGADNIGGYNCSSQGRVNNKCCKANCAPWHFVKQVQPKEVV
jgi:hypothetical protein